MFESQKPIPSSPTTNGGSQLPAVLGITGNSLRPQLRARPTLLSATKEVPTQAPASRFQRPHLGSSQLSADVTNKTEVDSLKASLAPIVQLRPVAVRPPLTNNQSSPQPLKKMPVQWLTHADESMTKITKPQRVMAEAGPDLKIPLKKSPPQGNDPAQARLIQAPNPLPTVLFTGVDDPSKNKAHKLKKPPKRVALVTVVVLLAFALVGLSASLLSRQKNHEVAAEAPQVHNQTTNVKNNPSSLVVAAYSATEVITQSSPSTAGYNNMVSNSSH
jgi:hypothetical protein